MKNEVVAAPRDRPGGYKGGQKVIIGLRWRGLSDVRCVFGKGQAWIELAVRPKDRKPKPGAKRRRSPRAANCVVPLPTDGRCSAELADGACLQIPCAGAERLEFYPGQHCSDIEGGCRRQTLSKGRDEA